jgi:UPF0716 protein FxsA
LLISTIDDPCRRANTPALGTRPENSKTAVMVKWIIIAILLLPLAEIAVFALVAALLGVGVALMLMLATTLVGFVMLRRAGRGGMARFRVAVADGDIAGFQANTGGFLTMLAGLLLFLPGFLTDLAGAVLLMGPVRRWCGQTFRQWVPPPPSCRRPLDDRSRTGRMAASSRPRTSAQVPAQARQTRLARVCRVLVGMGAPC